MYTFVGPKGNEHTLIFDPETGGLLVEFAKIDEEGPTMDVVSFVGVAPKARLGVVVWGAQSCTPFCRGRPPARGSPFFAPATARRSLINKELKCLADRLLLRFYQLHSKRFCEGGVHVTIADVRHVFEKLRPEYATVYLCQQLARGDFDKGSFEHSL